MTQILAHWTTVLDGRKSVKMTGRVYLRAVVPIGICFSLSLICGNLTYLYLSVAFIQMLKATTPVAVLISGWILGVTQPNLRQFLNVSTIVVGVIVASLGEIHFVVIGVLYQMGGIVFEALRLTMVQRLVNSPDFKMDPLVSVYYFAPICAVMNGVVALIWEVPRCSMEDVYNVGFFTFFLNGLCAFMLNVSVVFLVSLALFDELASCSSCFLTLLFRLARHPLSSLHFPVSSRILCLCAPPWQSGALPSLPFNSSATPSLWEAWSTTSLESSKSRGTWVMPTDSGLTLVHASLSCAKLPSSLAPYSSSSLYSAGWLPLMLLITTPASWPPRFQTGSATTPTSLHQTNEYHQTPAKNFSIYLPNYQVCRGVGAWAGYV